MIVQSFALQIWVTVLFLLSGTLLGRAIWGLLIKYEAGFERFDEITVGAIFGWVLLGCVAGGIWSVWK